MRLLPLISFGTTRYPEKAARRLRAMNIAAWTVALIAGLFAVRRLADPAGDKLIPGLLNLASALFFAAIPLLHRFGPLVATVTFTVFTYAFIFWVVSVGGTGGGAWLGYLVAVPLLVVLLGAERLALTVVFGAAAAALIVILHLTVPPDTGYVSPQSLFYGNFVTNIVFCTALLLLVVRYAVREIGRAEAAAEREYQRSERLLLNILPAGIAARLKTRTEPVIADHYEESSILFADIADFTERASNMTPNELVLFLNETYSRFDRLVDQYGLEKIKTTGDSYMVVSGVPVARIDHAAALADFALDMRDTVRELRDPHGRSVSVRIGMACGSVIAGVVGTRKIFFDVWGDAVNVASRMETTGEPGQIQVSQAGFERLKTGFDLDPRGSIEIKGKGRMETWYLVGRKAAAQVSDSPAAT
jgi:adenylate cyclase